MDGNCWISLNPPNKVCYPTHSEQTSNKHHLGGSHLLWFTLLDMAISSHFLLSNYFFSLFTKASLEKKINLYFKKKPFLFYFCINSFWINNPQFYLLFWILILRTFYNKVCLRKFFNVTLNFVEGLFPEIP